MRRALPRLALLVAMTTALGCRHRVPAGAQAADATAMGSWPAWRDLSPLVEIARDHAPSPAVAALERASGLLREGKPAAADRALAAASDGAGRHWISIARGDLVALHFTLCIRGVALRLSDGEQPKATERRADFSEQTRVEPGDISVEATLVNLEAAATAGDPVLTTQARIARARVAAFAQQCAANEEVATMAQESVEADLATLAAEGHLTPDLAYMWAGVQMSRFSGSAARPFLLQAQEGGFDHPAVTFMLAVIAFEDHDLDKADALAREATTIYTSAKDDAHVAEARFLQGEIARARKQFKAARGHYQAALALEPTHAASILARADLDGAEDSLAGMRSLQQALPALLATGPLDAEGARAAAENLERLLTIAVEPHQVQLVRDALVLGIESEPDAMRRGLRYFFAATLDVRLREYEIAHGHGVLARDEFEESGVQPPLDVEAFLSRLRGG